MSMQQYPYTAASQARNIVYVVVPRRHAIAPASFEVMPDEVLSLIIGHVATGYDHEDMSAVAMASKTSYRNALPFIWETVSIFSASDLIKLTKAVLQRGCGAYIRSLSWPLEQSYPVQSVRDLVAILDQSGILVDPVKLSRGFMLSEYWTRAASDLPDSTMELLEPTSYLLVTQIFKAIMLRTPHLQHLFLPELALAVLYRLPSPQKFALKLTKLSIEGSARRGSLDINKLLKTHSDSVADLAVKTFGPLQHLQSLTLSSLEAMQILIFSGDDSTWDQVRSLSINHRSSLALPGFKSKKIVTVVEAWQSLIDRFPNMVTFSLADYGCSLDRVGKPAGANRTPNVFPKVTFSPALRNLHLVCSDEGDAGSLVEAFSHCAALELISVSYPRYCSGDLSAPPSVIALDTLPSYLTTLMVDLPESNNVDLIVLPTLEMMTRSLEDCTYPPALSHICLNQAELDRHLRWPQNYTLSYNNIFPRLMAAVRFLNTACILRGVKLCGRSTSEPLLPVPDL